MERLAERELPSIEELLPPIAGAARRARDVITQACLQWEVPHLLAPATVVVSELVSNAVAHAQTMAELRVVRGSRHMVVMVYDGSTTVPTIPTASAIAARRYEPGLSRGLTLINAVADDWGFQSINGGKVVWAALRM